MKKTETQCSQLLPEHCLLFIIKRICNHTLHASAEVLYEFILSLPAINPAGCYVLAGKNTVSKDCDSVDYFACEVEGKQPLGKSEAQRSTSYLSVRYLRTFNSPLSNIIRPKIS